MHRNELPQALKPEYNGLTGAEIDAVLALTDRQLEYAYLIKRFQRRVADARCYVEELYGNSDPDIPTWLKEDDYEELVRLFEKYQDCEIGESDTWKSLITNFVEQDLPARLEKRKQEAIAQLRGKGGN